MKKWPQTGPVRFTDLIDPVRKAIKFAYDLKRKNQTKDIPWRGYNIGKRERCGSPSPDEKLTQKSLAWVLDDQGRDALDEILCVAIQLGIEQGRRVERQDTEGCIDLIGISIDAVRSVLAQLADRRKR